MIYHFVSERGFDHMTQFTASGVGYLQRLDCAGSSRPILHPGDGSKLCKLLGHRSETFGTALDIEGNRYQRLVCRRCGFTKLGMAYPKPKPRLSHTHGPGPGVVWIAPDKDGNPVITNITEESEDGPIR